MQLKAHKKVWTLVNEGKVERAKNGFLNGDNNRVGGVADDTGTYEPEKLLAEYDKLGGKIMAGTDTVKHGSFYDIKGRKPHATPKVVYTYNINGETVEVPEGAELPGIVKAARIMEGQKAAKAKKAAKGEEAVEDDEVDESDESADDEEEVDDGAPEADEEEEEAAPAPVKKAAPKKKAPVKKAAPVEDEEEDDED